LHYLWTETPKQSRERNLDSFNYGVVGVVWSADFVRKVSQKLLKKKKKKKKKVFALFFFFFCYQKTQKKKIFYI